MMELSVAFRYELNVENRKSALGIKLLAMHAQMDTWQLTSFSSFSIMELGVVLSLTA